MIRQSPRESWDVDSRNAGSSIDLRVTLGISRVGKLGNEDMFLIKDGRVFLIYSHVSFYQKVAH